MYLHMFEGNNLDTLFIVNNCKSKRCSSYAKDGSNADMLEINPGETVILADIKGFGIIRHIWCTMDCKDEYFLRKVVIRMYWDGEDSPSVEAPIGDFFGIGHGIRKDFSSLPLNMSPQEGKGFNCYFPMPFFKSARISITNECENNLYYYYYVDYEEYDRLNGNIGYFHAQWRRENPTTGWGCNPETHCQGEAATFKYLRDQWKTKNTTGDENYTILEAEGKGHYVGCNLNIDCFERQTNDWYGEGDDMIFIDGEPWPPSLHGTGTEDYFCTAFCPETEYNTLFSGLTLYSGNKPDKAGWRWGGKNSMYRFHIADPVHFAKSIKVTIEHGHNNDLSNDYSSTAYWYQLEPHKHYETLLPVEQRLPRPDNTKG